MKYRLGATKLTHAVQIPTLGLLLLSTCVGQNRNRPPSARSSCDSCLVQLNLLAELAETEEFPISTIRTAALVGNEIYVVFREIPFEIMVYEIDGRPSRRLGTRGEGPGEFEGIRYLASDKLGMLHVYDSRNSRITSLRADEVVNTIPVPFPMLERAGRPWSDSTHLVTTMPDHDGDVLHEIDNEGVVLGSFYKPTVERNGIFTFSRLSGTSDRLVAFDRYTHRIELVDREAGSSLLLADRPNWFGPTYMELEEQSRVGQEPMALAMDIAPAKNGHPFFWLASQKPNPFTQEGDCVIELFDAERASVIATRLVDEIGGVFLAPSMLLMRGKDRGGVPQYSVFTLSFTEKPAPSDK